MPRRNLYVLLAVFTLSMVCYRQADSAHRSEYGRMFDTLVEVFREIDANYLETVDEHKLFEGALRGAVNRLDPYSEYIGSEELAMFQEDVKQQFSGVGIQVWLEPETERLLVVSPLVGTPAYRAGVLAGDVIVAIDGKSTQGFSMQDAVTMLRGAVGEPVKLTVLHKGETEPTEITLNRDVIKTHTVTGDLLDADGQWLYFLEGDNGVAYVRISAFSEQTVEELKDVLRTLRASGMRGLILDLRNNSGGLLAAATQTCDLFLRQGRIVSIRGRGGFEQEAFEATGRGEFADVPLVVLVNQYSASASEIVAACLQDQQRATIVGQRSWGKGTVQTVVPLDGGTSALKLTTASYWRPSGKNIHRRDNAAPNTIWGVTPDEGYDVALADEQLGELIRRRHRRDAIHTGSADGDAAETTLEALDDPQLKRAIEALNAKIGQPAAA